jgi:hypothetical protein
MSDEHQFTLHQVDLARADFAAIKDELDSIAAQLARLPTRKDLARLTLLALTSGASLTIALGMFFLR